MSRYRAGYDSRPDLVAPTVSQGAAQRLASGTTSAAVTVAAATGGGGVNTYSAPAIDKAGGSGAAVSGTVPGALSVTGLADGESVVVSGTATDGTGQVVAWAHTVAVAAAGGGGATWTDLVDLDWSTVADASALSNGSHTISVSGESVGVDVSTYSGANGTVTPTAGAGMVMDGGTDTSGTLTLSIDLDPLFNSYTVADVRGYQYAVHVVITNLVYTSPSNSSVFCGLNRGTTATHNSGLARMIYVEDANDGTNERTRVRRNTSSSAIQATTTIKTSRVFTLILTMGEIVQVMDTSGTTPPTPAPTAAGTLMVGSDSVGLAQAVPDYQGNGLRCFISAGDASDLTLTRTLVQRRQQ